MPFKLKVLFIGVQTLIPLIFAGQSLVDLHWSPFGPKHIPTHITTQKDEGDGKIDRDSL